MATGAYQQSDYKTNVDQTDRHLHVTSGDKTLTTKDASGDVFETKILLSEILKEIKLTNRYLSEFLGDEFRENER